MNVKIQRINDRKYVGYARNDLIRSRIHFKEANAGNIIIDLFLKFKESTAIGLGPNRLGPAPSSSARGFHVLSSCGPENTEARPRRARGDGTIRYEKATEEREIGNMESDEIVSVNAWGVNDDDIVHPDSGQPFDPVLVL